jgi:Meckel syndrome type 1 protein
MLVNEKTFRRVNTSDKTLGWPVSTTESFFMDGERQEQEGWDLARLQASEPDPERMFTSFDRVPRTRWPLVVVGVLALLLIAAVASTRVPAARDLRRRTIAKVSAYLPPLHWSPPKAQPAPATTGAIAATTPSAPSVAAPAAAPEPEVQPAAAPIVVPSTAVSNPVAAAQAPAPVAAAPAPAPVAVAPAPAPVAAAPAPVAVPTETRPAAEPAAKAPSLSLIPWKETSETAAPAAGRRPAGDSVATPRRRAAVSASTARRGMVWSPQTATLVPTTPSSDPAPEIIPPSNTDSPPVAAAAPEHATPPSAAPSSSSGMASPSTIEPPSFQAAPAERPAPSSATEPKPFEQDKEKAPIIE